MPDTFDRLMGAMHGRPDVLATKPSTLREVMPVVGETVTYIVHTFREREKGDCVFVEVAGPGQHVRLVLPPRVADAIARQREALTSKSRSKAAKAEAERRSTAGILPAFGRARARKA